MGTGPAGVGGRDVGRRAGRPHGGGALWPDHAYGAVSGIVLGVGSIYDDIYVQRYAIPVADFTGAPLTGAAPLTVTFDNRSTPLYGTTGYTWTFGDGSTLLTTGGATSAITGPTHVYTTPGVYTVTLTVEVEDETATLTRTHYVTVTAAGGVMTSTRVISYVYDPLGRLVEADYSTGERYEYAYDAVGNRTVMTTTLGATSVTTYTYDAANRLTKVGDVAYTWDAWGNLTNDGVFTYTYNAAGRMVRAESVTATLVYTYTADGLRVAQSADGAVTTFAWDWATGVPELLSTGSARYLVGHDTLGQWDGAWTYYLPDALGSVRQATDGAGAVVRAREWSPYGVELGNAQPGLGYTGEWFDGDVGLLYLRARWYDGTTGRFTQKDPIAGLLSWGESYNAYGYAEQNSINRVDPSGLLSNETIRKSFGVGRFEDVLTIIELSGDWGYLKMLQDAEVGDRVYAGPFSWTSYLGTIECYDSSRHSPEPWYWPGPWKGGVVFVTPNREEHLVEQSKRMETYARPPDWYFLNNNQGPSPYTTKTDLGYLPDYVMVSGGPQIPIPGLIIVGVGGEFNLVVDRYGYVYVGLSGNAGVGLPLPFSASVVLGWINQHGLLSGDRWIPGQGELSDLIEGFGAGASANLLVGVGGSVSIADDFPRHLFKEAVGGEYLFSLPGAEVNFEGMIQLPGGAISRMEWDSVDRHPIEHGFGRQNIRMVDDRPVDCGC